MNVIALVDPGRATLYWYVARGSGLVVFGLLTIAVCLGILLSLKWRTDAWPRIITQELHPFIILTAGAFLGIHIISVLLDTFVHFQPYQVLIPFTSNYRPIWMGLGIVAMYLGTALAASSYLKRYIGYRLWRTMHYGGFVAWTLALVHGVTTGTDARAPWAIALYATSALVVVGLLTIRFGGAPIPLGHPPRFRPRLVAGLSTALVLAGVLAALGPWAHGWASRAQTTPLGSPRSPAVVSVVAGGLASFHSAMTGTSTLRQGQNLEPGTGLLHMQLKVPDRHLSLSYGLLLAASQNGTEFVRGIFSLAPSKLAWNCSGPVTYRPPDTLDSTCAVPGHQSVEIVARFRLDRSGQVSGTARGIPVDARHHDGEGTNEDDSQAGNA